ncbi:hypothetical protein [Candidatus Thiosymbion oneisti]|nr:hypothetical protein [Candidatus Thiosymbion oneisti]
MPLNQVRMMGTGRPWPFAHPTSWQVKNPATGRLERLPAETFGPIPGLDP